MSGVPSVLSPCLHLSKFSLKLCTLCSVTTSSRNAFHFFTVLCGKLYFPISFTHCLLLILFTCFLVLASSVTSIRSSFSIFFFQCHLLFYTLLLGLLVLFYLVRLTVPFPSAFLHVLSLLVPASSL
ncbi:hypothetical protein E2C01_038185 [Portunus trituberculatus]|uniref:Uncharacterized protein n=1 Tax=Portunus trituberculatus TaxID=210409 RepID=A0A5B7FDH8_PORTR|nr:hypothetical protein [Portunus trituberculatus]